VSVQTLAKVSADLRRLPRVVAFKVAEEAAPVLTGLAAATFSASEDAYGVPWAAGSDGGKVTLWKTGALSRFVRYVAIGTKLRVSLGVAYAKYQIGRRPVFPKQGGALPTEYARALERTAVDVVRREMGGV
jgi:hypothetical protein